MTIVAGSRGRAGVHAVVLLQQERDLNMTLKAFRSPNFSSPLVAGGAIGQSFKTFMAPGKGAGRDLGTAKADNGKQKRRQR